jgi:hypothetical protein
MKEENIYQNFYTTKLEQKELSVVMVVSCVIYYFFFANSEKRAALTITAPKIILLVSHLYLGTWP